MREHEEFEARLERLNKSLETLPLALFLVFIFGALLGWIARGLL